MKTYASSLTNSFAVTRPIPWSPPVISAIRPSSFPICFSFNSPTLDRTASRKSWCAHRVVSKRALSDRIFRVLYGPRGSKPKNGLQIDLKAHLLSSGNFFASLFYGEDDPEALTLNCVNAGYNGPVRSKEADHAIWDPDTRHNNHPLRYVRHRAEGCTSSVGR